MERQLYIGLMSGTSLDAVDAVLVDFSNQQANLLAAHSEPIDLNLKKDILALCEPGDNAIMRMGTTDVKLGSLFTNSVLELLDNNGVAASDIKAIGSHGQTIRHVPNSDVPFTIQIGDPNIIAATTGITTVADFRRRDLALGGQAAPLAPAFHDYLLQNRTQDQWVLNIGGIANFTFLPGDSTQSIIGFDTGPGNTLLDAFASLHTKLPYDENGDWARSGQCQQELLEAMLADPYLKQAAPKSTGREYFNLSWLQKFIDKKNIAPEDIENTLTELTAKSIANAIASYSTNTDSLWVCGGGIHNNFLCERIEAITRLKLKSTEELGIHPDWIEACAFAWLAQQTLLHQPGNVPSVTGARHATVLGAIYPGILD